MANGIKIAIVEDELLIAENIKMMLDEIGYNTCEPVSGYAEALEMLKQQKPDLVLLDINLRAEKDGIDIAKQINEHYHLPFIFLTANSDKGTIEKAKEVKPNAYLVKPFTQEELFAAIEICFNNYMASKPEASVNEQPVKQKRDFIFIKDGYRFLKIHFNDLIFLESRSNYLVIHSYPRKETMVRSTLTDFLSQMPAEKFCRIHKSYAVNTELVENVEPTEIIVSGIRVPCSSTHRSELLAKLGIKEE